MTLPREKFDENRPRMSAAAFASALEDLDLTGRAAAQRLGVNERTLRRWVNDEEEIPLAVELAVRFAVALIWFKQQWFEKYGLEVQVAVMRTLCLDLLGSHYPEMRGVPGELDDAVFDDIDDEDEDDED